MSTHSPVLRFASDAFPLVPDEDAETTPGVYGLSLARWLELKLQAAGHGAEEAFPEEYGWCVPVGDGEHRLYVGCCNADEAGARWEVFAFVDTGVFGAVVDDSARQSALTRLFEALRSVLDAAPEVRELQVGTG